ncbi:MAG: MFS transporter [Promethearchaeota archaeon]
MNDSNNNQEIASTKKMLSYSLGFVITNSIGYGVSQVLFYFYEVEVRLPVVLVGFSFVIFAIWNAINDPLVGYLTDRPFKFTKKWGMRFPWILIGGVPTLIFWMLLFIPPDIDPLNPWPVFLFFVIMACAMDGFFSLYATHLGAGYTIHFRTDEERRKAGAFNNAIPQTVGLFLGFIFPLIYVYGQKSTASLAVFYLVLAYAVCLIFLIPGIKESDIIKERFLQGYKTEKHLSFFQTMKIALKRKNYLVTIIIFLFTSTAWNLYLSSGIYFVKDILRKPLSVNVFISIGSFLGFVGFIPMWVKIAGKIGHVKTMKIGLIIAGISCLPSLWITTVWEAVFYSFVGGIAFGAHSIMIGPITAAVYDEITVETERHQEAKLEGVRTFFLRFAFILQALIITVIHILTQYNPDPLAIQTPLATWGIRIQMALVPCLFYIAAALMMIFFYNLTEVREREIRAKMLRLKL